VLVKLAVRIVCGQRYEGTSISVLFPGALRAEIG